MTHKENITAILECYFTGFKKEIIDSACNRILEQERCEDTISRQAVLDYIKSLPPVTPRKTGKWIETDLDIYECSECHEGHSVGFKENFCPNCGAKMQEVSE